jgi:SAM-dependent methyltransferase
MKTTTARRLLRLNRAFYDAFATEFSDSRRALQPGIRRALRALGGFDSILDVGCGDGRIQRALADGIVDRRVSRYVGVDSSAELLGRAGPPIDPARGVSFVLSDLANPDWLGQVARYRPFDAAVCFSVLHHIPGARRRLRLLRAVRTVLRPGGRCAVSVWQFLHVRRLSRKIVPWSEVGLPPGDVDANDYLIDWRQGGQGLRYVHHFDEAELAGLCRSAGFRVLETFRSDGQTGDLGLYAIVER